MTTFYKFPDQATFDALNTDVPVDVIGTIEGFHVNTLRSVENWSDYEIAVTSPVRIFG